MRQGRFVVAAVAVAAIALVAAARAQDGDKKEETPQHIEYIRIPLYSLFHPTTEQEARMERGLYIGSTRNSTQDWKLPVEVPVGATVLEVGVVGQTSNQVTVRLDREDWTPVYAFGETQPKDAGSWTCCSITEKGLTRKTAKPMPDDQNIPVPKREFEEQGFVVTVIVSRSPNATKEDKAAAPNLQKDKVMALWLKIGK
jgi:hypothetical protein